MNNTFNASHDNSTSQSPSRTREGDQDDDEDGSVHRASNRDPATQKSPSENVLALERVRNLAQKNRVVRRPFFLEFFFFTEFTAHYPYCATHTCFFDGIASAYYCLLPPTATVANFDSISDATRDRPWINSHLTVACLPLHLLLPPLVFPRQIAKGHPFLNLHLVRKQRVLEKHPIPFQVRRLSASRTQIRMTSMKILSLPLLLRYHRRAVPLLHVHAFRPLRRAHHVRSLVDPIFRIHLHVNDGYQHLLPPPKESFFLQAAKAAASRDKMQMALRQDRRGRR